MLASVVIPAKGRVNLLNRAIESVLKSKNSQSCEIIVIDDGSEIPIASDLLRDQDKLIRLDESKGAAVARNIGIDNAQGEVIFLLDSDDYFVDRDFVREHELATSHPYLFYSEISSQLYQSNFDDEVTLNDFFQFIFFKRPHICQTSSLYFAKDTNIRFDESLPKHQDWDLLLYSALLAGIKVKKGSGRTFFDRMDRGSLSRKLTAERSKVWFSKLSNDKNNISEPDLKYIRYNLFSHFCSEYSWLQFLSSSLKYLFLYKTSPLIFAKKVYYRFK